MRTLLAVLVTLLGLVGGDNSPTKGDYYPNGGYPHGGGHYPGSVYPHGGGYYPGSVYPHGGGNYPGSVYPHGESNYPYPGSGYPYPGHGDCNTMICFAPACPAETCRNFPYARCVGVCNNCVARFFLNGVDVTPYCGEITGTGRHHKRKTY